MNDDSTGGVADHGVGDSQQSKVEEFETAAPVRPAPRPALGTRAMALVGFAVPALGIGPGVVGEQTPVFG